VDYSLPPRLTDASILLAVLAAVVSGVVGLVTGDPRNWWVFSLHGVVGFVLVALLFSKFRRVYPRVTRGSWNRTVVVSVLTSLVAVTALATGIAWVFGLNVDLLYWNLMNAHVLFGLLVVPLLAVHLLERFRLPARADFEGRRTALAYLGLAGFGALAWTGQGVLNRLLSTAGANRRFTGSRERGGDGRFPTTIWMADDPDPIDAGEYALSVEGAVADPYELAHDELLEFDDRQTAVLDCTSGWYTEQEWTGVRVGRLLERADLEDDASHVSFRSVTGYRWSLPLEEARDALLARIHVVNDVVLRLLSL